MNESTENAPKILYNASLYKELDEMWRVYNVVINNCEESDVVADINKILSERIIARLAMIMKDLPIHDGYKLLIVMEEDPDLHKRKRNWNIDGFMVVWHGSGLMYMNRCNYQYFLDYINRKETKHIKDLLGMPNMGEYLLANEFDYEFGKIKSSEDIVQMVQENAQNQMTYKLIAQILTNAKGISCAYGNHFDCNEIPLITRYTLSRVCTMYNQHTTDKIDNIATINMFAYIMDRKEQKINSLLKQINNAEKLIATMPTIYARFDEFKQHITARIIRLMLDEENSKLSLRKHYNYDNWAELAPTIDLYPGLINVDKQVIITPGHQLYNLRASILAKYTSFANQTLTTDEARKNAATIFVPTEQHTDSVLQDISTLDHLDSDTYSIADIKQISISIAETNIPDPTVAYSTKFKTWVDRYAIMWELFRAVNQVYEENPDDRERIENCIRTTISSIMNRCFADPNSTEFKQYIDACKTCITNVKTNVIAIRDALLSSDDTDFIKYLYENKHIYKREYDARIKQIEEQDSNEIIV